VYKNLKIKMYQKLKIKTELVQFLEDESQARIRYDGFANTVNLTDQGLQWAERMKDKPPYLEYRPLLNG
jgi:hypothetical protein